MCTLDNEYFFNANPSPAEVAATIVHEATHAQLHNIGIEYTEEMRARIEKLCFEAEIAFAKRLPDSEELIKNAEARLKIPETFWTNDEFVQRGLDSFSELGKKSTFARLLYPIVKWLVNRKRTRHD